MAVTLKSILSIFWHILYIYRSWSHGSTLFNNRRLSSAKYSALIDKFHKIWKCHNFWNNKFRCIKFHYSTLGAWNESLLSQMSGKKLFHCIVLYSCRNCRYSTNLYDIFSTFTRSFNYYVIWLKIHYIRVSEGCHYNSTIEIRMEETRFCTLLRCNIIIKASQNSFNCSIFNRRL